VQVCMCVCASHVDVRVRGCMCVPRQRAQPRTCGGNARNKFALIIFTMSGTMASVKICETRRDGCSKHNTPRLRVHSGHAPSARLRC
jgi:hypothetical protein